MGFWVFLIHPTVVSVILSASIERCFVSRMQDFYIIVFKLCFWIKEKLFVLLSAHFAILSGLLYAGLVSGGCFQCTAVSYK